jgi:hypothetical protein
MKYSKSQQYQGSQAIQELLFDNMPRISQNSNETACTDKRPNPFDVATEKTLLSMAYQSSKLMNSQMDQ